MSNTTLRCKNCNTKYILDKNSSREYCPICQKAITDALKNIPRKYDHKFVELTDTDRYEEINQIFNEEKEKYLCTATLRFSLKNDDLSQLLIDEGKYLENIEILYYKRRKYVRGQYKNNPYKYIFVDMEFSTLNGDIIDYWYYDAHKSPHYIMIKN